MSGSLALEIVREQLGHPFYIVALNASDFVAVNKKVVPVGFTTPIMAGVVVFFNGYLHLLLS